MLRIKTLMAFTLAAACGLVLWLPLFEAPKRRGNTAGPNNAIQTPREMGTSGLTDLSIFKC